MNKAEKIRDLRRVPNLSQTAFGEKYRIPLRTVQGWELGEREAPDYVIDLLEKAVWEDKEHVYLTWALIDNCGTEEWVTPAASKAEALQLAESDWNRLTSSDKKRRESYLVGLVNLDENGDYRLRDDGSGDGDIRVIARVWK